MTFVILMRRRHLDNTTFVFLKHVIFKRENNNEESTGQEFIGMEQWLQNGDLHWPQFNTIAKTSSMDNFMFGLKK